MFYSTGPWPYSQVVDSAKRSCQRKANKHCSLSVRIIGDEGNNFCNIDTRCLIHKHFMRVTYGCSKIGQCIVQEQTCKKARAVNYTRTMLMKSATGRLRIMVIDCKSCDKTPLSSYHKCPELSSLGKLNHSLNQRQVLTNRWQQRQRKVILKYLYDGTVHLYLIQK